ncbi:carbohydrate ABC transporter permease [Paenibacillus chondroitinus]|uniref:Carbohydrate ABC transporter permease n=1 Tax=Paenibacillus chondroitinus TaxID=59842 RepID=A0ABU6D5N5_9BACL|nr:MULTISPECIES: carbohydrate ABC transporter permease [Paenibacillus]MCY9660132.1 carbohydrate ABC transporter permease [Paenibacillus anseongense]MEB4793009.1 carbohydrate ABC transporter permease [Paenibacillus chondroitinus]
MNKVSQSEKVFDAFIVVIMIGLVLVTLYPLVYVALASISDASSLMAHKGLLLKPYGINFEAYKRVLTNASILTGYSNTFIIIVLGVFINLLLTSLGAYVLSRKNVLWNRAFIFIILLTMFFQGGLIPLYLIVKGVGLYNSLLSLVLPFAISTFNLIIMRTSFMAIPDSLEESAKIDGANHFIILFRIIIPLSMPVIAVMIMFYAVEKWNGWFYASIFLKDRDLFPLQLILREILLANSTESMTAGSGSDQGFQIAETIKYATIMVATLPILFFYPIVSKYFVKGVMVGALKG